MPQDVCKMTSDLPFGTSSILNQCRSHRTNFIPRRTKLKLSNTNMDILHLKFSTAPSRDKMYWQCNTWKIYPDLTICIQIRSYLRANWKQNYVKICFITPILINNWSSQQGQIAIISIYHQWFLKSIIILWRHCILPLKPAPFSLTTETTQ